MGRDYFQDIMPPSPQGSPRAQAKNPTIEHVSETSHTAPLEADRPEPLNVPDETPVQPPELATPERSIRNITAPQRRQRDDIPRTQPEATRSDRKRFSMWWIGLAALLCFTALTSLLLVAMRGTRVSVVPKSHTIVFDETARVSAFPSTLAASGSLMYNVETVTLEAKETVQASGSTRVERKATGVITVTNNHSSSPIRLVKNTRFESSAGLIFRANADFVIPGKSGSVPGQITVSVTADAPGEQYNIQGGTLTIPGLKGSAEYTTVLGSVSTGDIAGGFAGDEPTISEQQAAEARSKIRSTLESQLREKVAEMSQGETRALLELAELQFQDLPTVSVEGSSASVGERLIARIPVVQNSELARAIGKTVAADVEVATLSLFTSPDFAAVPIGTTTALGTGVLNFGFTGKAAIVWVIDKEELGQALAGRDESAFTSIIDSYPGIESARTRIQPFWRDSFPDNPQAMSITIQEFQGF